MPLPSLSGDLEREGSFPFFPLKKRLFIGRCHGLDRHLTPGYWWRGASMQLLNSSKKRSLQLVATSKYRPGAPGDNAEEI